MLCIGAKSNAKSDIILQNYKTGASVWDGEFPPWAGLMANSSRAVENIGNWTPQYTTRTVSNFKADK